MRGDGTLRSRFVCIDGFYLMTLFHSQFSFSCYLILTLAGLAHLLTVTGPSCDSLPSIVSVAAPSLAL